MKRIRFLGPGHVLRVAGQEIKRGEVGEVPDEDVARMLPHSRHIRFDVLKPEAESGEGQDKSVHRHGKKAKE